MSKSAIKALTKAQEIMAIAGVEVNLVGYISIPALRKNWRSADQLAALIIDSAANAFGIENSTTFAANEFKDMADAVERYINANLDDWTQESFVSLEKTTAGELRRLAAQVALNVDFEAREAAHAVALEVQHRRRVAEYFMGLDYAGRCAKLDADHMEAILMNYDYESNQLEALRGQPAPKVCDYAGNTRKFFPVGYRDQVFFNHLDPYQQNFLMALAHEEALAIDKQMHQDEFFNAAPMMRGVWVNLNHAEALEDDRQYQTAIATIADSVSNPSSLVWRGCSDTVKAQIIKHHHDEALRMNASLDVTGTIEPPMDIRVQRFPAAIEALQAHWSSLNACQRSAILALAHDAALEVNRQLDELRDFTLIDGGK
ncbi:hypothetical protein HWC07_gp026 [Pantoea phage vB_PagM_LIET2]|uniref:Uncharacterized protein n=1 Tax=Pantoea phage vB_PagM_LIET2 TaxID=2508071 RepID=A0A411AW09_9CAUD|nr:hypothetical protein HWC07_gp026 [Pantoea phage vB_PagM_LIET2]QAX92278.1 hypothetical protein LIET2_gp026 [Pantoea phage vB_PagM_LIET2]